MANFTQQTSIEAIKLDQEFTDPTKVAECFSEQPDWLLDLIASARIVPRRAPDNSHLTGEKSPEWEGFVVATNDGMRPTLKVGDYLTRGEVGQVHAVPAEIFEAQFKQKR